MLVLRTSFRQDAQGKDIATSSLDVFLKVENATASLIAKTVNPIVGRTADHNFIESLNFVQRLNETTEQNGPGVQRMANRLTDLTPDVRNNFVRVAGVVYERNAAAQPEATSALPPATSIYPPQSQAPVPSPYQSAARQLVAPPSHAQVNYQQPGWNGGPPPSMTQPIPVMADPNQYSAGAIYQAPFSAGQGYRWHGQASGRPAAAVQLPPIVQPDQRRSHQAPNYPKSPFHRFR